MPSPVLAVVLPRLNRHMAPDVSLTGVWMKPLPHSRHRRGQAACHRPPPQDRRPVATPDSNRYGLDTTGAFTTMDVSVIISLPFLARLLIMSSLVSGFGETPGFHLTMTVRHSGE